MKETVRVTDNKTAGKAFDEATYNPAEASSTHGGAETVDVGGGVGLRTGVPRVGVTEMLGAVVGSGKGSELGGEDGARDGAPKTRPAFAQNASEHGEAEHASSRSDVIHSTRSPIVDEDDAEPVPSPHVAIWIT